MRRLFFWGVAVLSLTACFASENELGSVHTKGTDININSYSINDDSIQLDFEWTHGSDEDSMLKNSFNDLGIEIKAFQDGQAMFYDAEQAMSLFDKGYDGSEHNASLGFSLNNEKDVIEVRFDNFDSPGIFIDINDSSNKGSSETRLKENGLSFYKTWIYSVTDDHYLLIEALIDSEVKDILFLSDSIRKKSKDIDVYVDYFNLDSDFKDRIKFLSDSYIEFSNFLIDVSKGIASPDADVSSEINKNIGIILRDITDKYYDEKLPPAMVKMLEDSK